MHKSDFEEELEKINKKIELYDFLKMNYVGRFDDDSDTQEAIKVTENKLKKLNLIKYRLKKLFFTLTRVDL